MQYLAPHFTQQAPTKNALSCSSSVTEKFTKKSATWNCACVWPCSRTAKRPGVKLGPDPTG